LLAIAAAAAALGVATLFLGDVRLRIGTVELLRNSHAARPFVIAFGLATLAGRGMLVLRLLLPVAVLMIVLPLNEYENGLRDLVAVRHPLRDTGACMLRVQGDERAAGKPAPGIYAIGEARWFLHSYFYYFRQLGWDRVNTLEEPTVRDGLFVPGRQRPIIMDDDTYRTVKQKWPNVTQEVPVVALRDALLLLPGPYSQCPRPTAPVSFK
jgi:hypothetical protein